MGRTVADILVIADDLTGAAEAAAALVGPNGGHAVPVHLLREGDDALELDHSRPVVIDTNSRNARTDHLSTLLAPAATLVKDCAVVIKKIDSLLRGDIAAEVELLRPSGRRAVIAPALPSAGRVMRDGQMFIAGVPLVETAAWVFEQESAPRRLSKSFSTQEVTSLGLDIVRSGETTLKRAITTSPNDIIVCDAETDDDLRRIAAATLHSGELSPLLVGSSALVTAVARCLDSVPLRAESTELHRRNVAFVVGTAEPSAHRQLAVLEMRGCVTLRLDPTALLDDRLGVEQRGPMTKVLSAPLSAIAIDPLIRVDRDRRAHLATALGRVLKQAIQQDTVFTLTGGQTSRAILDAWRTRTFNVHRMVSADAAWGLTDAGISVITRPGSFGDDDGFLRILTEIEDQGKG